jgi:hypothetical protein
MYAPLVKSLAKPVSPAHPTRHSSKPFQAKLTVGRVDDPLEREADRVADSVVSARPIGSVSGSFDAGVQRKCAECAAEEEHVIRRKCASSAADGRIDLAAATSTSRKGMAPAGEQRPVATSSVEQIIAHAGSPLESQLRQDMELRFHHDFSQVRVHADRQAGDSARQLQSRAYTVGQHIVFANSEFSPATLEGRKLLAHELTHVVQQGKALATIQRAPKPTPDRTAAREAAVAEAEAYVAASCTSDQIEAQSEAEDALRLDVKRSRSREYAWSLGLKDRDLVRKKGEVSSKLQREIAVKVRFFSLEAKSAYVTTVMQALADFAEPLQVQEMLAPCTDPGEAEGGKAPRTCDIAHNQYVLEHEDEPWQDRCIDISDPELTSNYFDRNIRRATAYAVPGTTWENVNYDSFKVLLVEYGHGKSEYFVLSDIGHFYYGGKTLIILEHSYLKRKNGLIYPVRNGQVYFSEVLTPNIIKYRNGYDYTIKELRDLYALLQAAGAFTSIVGAYGLGANTFKASINAFRRSAPPKLPGRPLPGIGVRKDKRSGVPDPIEDEPTAKLRPGEKIGETVGEYQVSGEKGLRGNTFQRDIYGLNRPAGKTNDIKPIMGLVRQFIAEAKAAGATRLRIVGHVVRNEHIMKIQRLATSLGGTAKQKGSMSIEIDIPVP